MYQGRSLSSALSFCIEQGLISCQVFGATRYSGDLVKGGLEIQCILRFESGSEITEKARKLTDRLFATKQKVLLWLIQITLILNDLHIDSALSMLKE